MVFMASAAVIMMVILVVHENKNPVNRSGQRGSP